MPSHVGIPGNEAADKVARSGVHLPEEQIMDVPATLRAVSKVARALCKSHNATLTKFILSLCSKECITLVGVLTGHCLVAAHAHRLGIIDDDTCTKCMEQGVRGTMEHLLCYCPALCRARLMYLGSTFYNSLEDVSKVSATSLLKFVDRTRILIEKES